MKGRGNYLCLHRFEQVRQQVADGLRSRCRVRRRVEHARRRADHRAVGTETSRPATAPRSRTCPRTCPSGTRSPRPRRIARHRVPALPGLLRHPHAAARRRIRRRHRQPPPAVRGRGRPSERVRRGDPELPLRGRRRGAPARGRRDAILRLAVSNCGSTTSARTSSARTARAVGRDGREAVLRGVEYPRPTPASFSFRSTRRGKAPTDGYG